MNFRLSGILVVGSFVVLSACSASSAQETTAPSADNGEQRVWISRLPRPMPHMRHARMHRGNDMQDMDANDDGLISREEFDSHHGLKFDEMDGDSDGFISENEIDDYADAIVEEVMEDFDFEFEFDTEEFAREMEEMGEEMSRAGERMAREMHRHGREIERRREIYVVDERDIDVRIEEKKDETFARLDKNDDGKLSRDEYPGPDRRFNNMDKNNNGFVERDELKVLMRITNSIRPMGHRNEEIEIVISKDEE